MNKPHAVKVPLVHLHLAKDVPPDAGRFVVICVLNTLFIAGKS
jgi:hypothetical protein